MIRLYIEKVIPKSVHILRDQSLLYIPTHYEYVGVYSIVKINSI